MSTLFKHLCGYADKKRISFAMPGHKGGRGFSDEFRRRLCEIDVTELSGTENLHAPREIIAAAQKRLAVLYQSDESYFLTGGSTEGVHIMIHAACHGGRLLVNRSSHRSAVNCCVLSGTEPVFIPQVTDGDLFIPECPRPELIEKILSEQSGIDAVLITSPNYYGQLADVRKIAQICHSHSVPLLVDEAHGAHFAAPGMPEGAVACGADMAVQSAHKTLNALNQAAFLHIKSDLIDYQTVRALTAMVGTSSPSYPIVSSAEAASEELLSDDWCDLADYIAGKKRALSTETDIIMPSGRIDPTRVVFGFKNYGISGYDVEKILDEKYGIDTEMSDSKNVVCIITPSNTREEIDLLFKAAKEIAQSAGKSSMPAYPPPPLPKAVLSPREAFYKKGETVRLESAAGRICKAAVAAYPPGIAVISYGEEITPELIEYIETITKLGASVEGMEKDGIRVIVE